MASILVFGDQTDSWIEGLDQIYRTASYTPWLKSFLADLTSATRHEMESIGLDRFLADSVGHFSSLHELGDRYRHSPDNVGLVRTLLLHTVRAGMLLQWAKKDPDLIKPASLTEWLGISGGLLSLSALAISQDFETLYDASLEAGRLVVRLSKFTLVRSRSLEDHHGPWGWAVLGVSLQDLSPALDEFQHNMGVPLLKRARVGVSGPGWHTIIGPPSVLELCVKQCPTVRDAPKNSLDIHALQHTMKLSQADVDFIVGTNTNLLDRPLVHQNRKLWGMDEPTMSQANWGELLRSICRQVLSLPLEIPQVFDRLAKSVGPLDPVKIIQLGTSSHTPYLATALKSSGAKVFVYHEQNLAVDEVSYAPTIDKIAIVGMSGRGPESDNLEELWDVIMTKRDTCTEVPQDRFNVDDYYCLEHGKSDKKCTMTTKYGCFMNKPGHFDARFFHISPREAMLMDPGHRQFLMCTYEALEMAGYSDGRTRTIDPHRIAAFHGQCNDDWHDAAHPTLGCDAYTLQGIQRAFGPGRLAWQFKWEGPTYSLDTACASTTASIHLACMSLQAKEIDMAVAGAANILSYPHSFTCLSKSGVLSDTGNCKTYRDDADGYCRADFVGAVVLKRLEDAVAQNDNILGVIAASGRNHSGNSTSITTSDAGAQERLFRRILREGGVGPDDVGYVEMHGTGTPVGDPAEVGAVGNIFRHRRPESGTVPVGSIKANLGHSEAATGMSSLLKCLTMFQRDLIPPQAGMPHALNARFPPLEELKIDIPSEARSFPPSSDPLRQPRRILLNNFDAAGGNASMLLEEFPQQNGPRAAADARPIHVFATSARTQNSLQANKRKILTWLQANPQSLIQDIAYTTTARRMHHPFRFACTSSTTQELIAKLEAEISAESSPLKESPPVVFVFTGQGSHYAGMGRELYQTNPVFRDRIDLCVSLCEQHGYPPFLDIIKDAGNDLSAQSTLQTQLAVVALEAGLAAFWESIGVTPSVVMGHSLGEYVALHVAGVLSLADMLYLVGQRALLLLERSEAHTYAMLNVAMPANAIKDMLQSSGGKYPSCAVACMNSPSATVISGSTYDIAALQNDLSVNTKVLQIPYGFHSAQMDHIIDSYVSLANGITFSRPTVPVASTLLATIVDGPGTFGGRYLGQQMRHAVNFVGALNSVAAKWSDAVWLEVGPTQVCTSFIRATLSSATPPRNTLSTLETPRSGSCWLSISKCLAMTYNLGVSIDWLAFHAPFAKSLRMVNLPSYAWDLKDFWVPYVDPRSESSAVGPGPSVSPAQQFHSTCAQHVVEESFSPKKIRVTMGASLAEPGLKALIEGHRMVGQPIAAGSIFCDAAFAATTYALRSIGREEDAEKAKLIISNPIMSRPLNQQLVGAEGQLLTTVVMESSGSDEIQVSWKAAPSSTTTHQTAYNIGSCIIQVCKDVDALQARWDRTSYFIKARMDEVIQAAKEGEGHRLQADIFYSLFLKAVQYEAHFKCVRQAFVNSEFTESAAEIVLKNDPVGTRFVLSPYWGEAIAHLAGFTVNANPDNFQGAVQTSWINTGFESFEYTATLEAGRPYFAYVRITPLDQNDKSCDVFIFDMEDRLISQILGCRFHQIGNDILERSLGSKSKSAVEPREAGLTPNKTSHQQKPVAAPQKVEKMPEEETLSPIPAPSPSNHVDMFGAMLESIASETGIDPSELTDDTAVADLGVDSIMAIEVTSKVSQITGEDMLPSILSEHPTIGHLRRALAAKDSPMTSTKITPANPKIGSESPSSESWNDSTSSQSGQSEDLVLVSRPASSVALAAKLEQKRENPAVPAKEAAALVDDTSPQPQVRITLLQGRSNLSDSDLKSQPPLYLVADGTGTIASYIHIPTFKSKTTMYGIDSPFIRCPTRLTPEVGIVGIAALIVEALVKKQREGVPFWIGGFSGGAMIAYEICRQLAALGHVVEGLLIIDMCCPRPPGVSDNADIGLAFYEAVAGSDQSGVWSSSKNTYKHLERVFACVATYHPPQLSAGESPPAKRTAVIWARRGMIGRTGHSVRLQKLLAEQGISMTPRVGFMEDPKYGAVAWSLANKSKGDLGANGWDRWVGSDTLACYSMDSDHLEMPTPGYAKLLGEAMEESFSHLKG